MSRKEERKRERKAAWAIEQEAMYVEQRRRAQLCMYDRIEEFVADPELRVILHKLAEQCGLGN